ncbi:MAG: NAD(P)(+) transhydrogenase (Re/Si-specific) subunit alpha, partial [Ferruginibacter sp.]|nr:NAD(P)(+) transhydrogenase (Re/Si-specific) subunit alpha [Ferruginibacter sp.]
MIIGLLKEPSHDTRVSLLPEHIASLKKLNVHVLVEKDAGLFAFANDQIYSDSGAVIATRKDIFEKADILLCINPLNGDETNFCKGKILIGFYHALYNAALISQYNSNNCTIFSMDMLPRTTRAQSMDVLSS